MEDEVMTLARLSDRMFPSMPSFFNNFLTGDLLDWGSSNYSSTDTTLPAVNIRENDESYIIEMAAPGLSKENFKVNLNRNRLEITSEKKEEKNEEDQRYSRREFSYQSFQRTFTLPEGTVEGEKIAARYTDGILMITIPKREEVKPKPARNIEIN